MSPPTIASLQMATLRFSTHINMYEPAGLLMQSKTFADYPDLDEALTTTPDDLTWWATTLTSGRQSTT